MLDDWDLYYQLIELDFLKQISSIARDEFFILNGIYKEIKGNRGIYKEIKVIRLVCFE